jgi:hypothetical protein
VSELAQLRELVEGTRLPDEEVATRTARIAAGLLGDSPYLREPNFTSFHPDDLERLFDSYDRLFFGGLCRSSLGERPLHFRLASRMTRTGGTTTRFRRREPPFDVWFEIAVSTPLLFQSFRDVDRPIVVNGRECRHRLDALQRIMEHELIHLVETLIWDESQCSAARFQSIAGRFFGHTDHRHHLVTQHERASKQFGVQPGQRVRFRFEGREYCGVVNRITKRATVLVDDEQGTRYTDGRRYKKFYIPLSMLEPVDDLRIPSPHVEMPSGTNAGELTSR